MWIHVFKKIRKTAPGTDPKKIWGSWGAHGNPKKTPRLQRQVFGGEFLHQGEDLQLQQRQSGCQGASPSTSSPWGISLKYGKAYGWL